MVRECDACRARYTAKRATSKYCSPRCRQRALRAPKNPQGLSAVPPLTAEQAAASTLSEATHAELKAAGREDTILAAVAVMLARRLESPSTDTGSSVAALVKEYRSTMAAALEGTRQERTPLDDLRDRYRARQAGVL